jgi:hypothetical protein
MISYSLVRLGLLGMGNCPTHDCSDNWDIGILTCIGVPSQAFRARIFNSQFVAWLLYECVLRSQAVRRFKMEGAMHVMRHITMKVPLVFS